MNKPIQNHSNLRWKRILLIKPNSNNITTNIYQTRFDAPPLNLAYIASYLSDLDVEVAILDTKIKKMNYSQIRKKIKKFKPDVVGISVFVSLVINICYDLAKIAKNVNQECTVVFGGRHPSAKPEETLNTNEVDIIVRGEGELTFRELILKGTPENVDGISYKSNGKIVHNPDRQLIKDLGKLRYPARHLMQNNKYRMFTVRFDTIQMSRGCPYTCKFCYTPVFNKGVWRARPVESIITELKVISQNRKITDIFIVDDNLTVNTRRIEQLCDRIIECKQKKEINDFYFIAQVRVDSIGRAPQMVKKMAKAGFCVVFMGIESINNETLKGMGKGYKFKKVLKALNILHKHHIIVLGNMIIGFNLNESEEDVKQEMHFMKRVDIDELGYSILVPFPGTPIFRELDEK